MSSVTRYANEDIGFYPTPKEVAFKMLERMDFTKIKTILEPSAGKGDLVSSVLEKASEEISKYRCSKIEVDCIEIDPGLRAILNDRFCKGWKDSLNIEREKMRDLPWSSEEYKKLERKCDLIEHSDIRIVGDDFLKFQTHKHYDLIVMNPPFEKGDLHLLHALDLQEDGGTIVCLLNADTIRNPFSKTRQLLSQKLKEYGAEIEFLENSFSEAERKTDVDVAMVTVRVPEKENTSFIFENLKKEQELKEDDSPDPTSVTHGDYIDRFIEQYNFETEATIRLIKEYKAFQPYMLLTFDKDIKPYPILSLQLNDGNRSSEFTVNDYLKVVRGKYWSALFNKKEFSGALTENLYKKYFNLIKSMEDYDFTRYNINSLYLQMMSELTHGVNSTVLGLFDDLSSKHSWFPECESNIHYFNGWATNKAHKINNKKVIVPMYGAFAETFHRGALEEYSVCRKLGDIEKVFNYLDTELREGPDLDEQIRKYSEDYITKKIPLKYFTVTFYKKGTCHIEWKYPELVDKLNIIGCQNKKWLPPCYGKKHYKEMDDDEKAVINEFQGENEYERVMKNKEFYLEQSGSKMHLLAATNE